MKKLLCSVLVVGTIFCTTAQTKIIVKDQQTNSLKKKKSLSDYKRNYDLNRAKLFNPNLQGSHTAVANSLTGKNLNPSASIYTQLWGEVNSVARDKKFLFQLNFNYGANAKVVVKLLDDQINVAKSFTVALPESANSFAVLNEFYYDADGKMNFLIYVHYFEGDGGPENQVNSIFVVNESGELRASLDGYSAKVVSTNSGPQIMTIHDTGDQVKVTNYDLSDFSESKTMGIPMDLVNFMAGSPINFMDVKGVPSLVLAHYEKLFLDNDTFEVFPDNHLIVDIYDFDLNLKKSLSLDITTAYPEEPYTIPMAEFAMFYGYGKYDITDHTFNDDDNLEVLYGISYFDLLGDNEWNHYFVGDENGNRIKSLEETIVGRNELQEIIGHDDQIGLFIGENDQISSLQMFDIKSWTPKFEFPAVYNGEFLSLNFNRIPVGDSYDYLFGMPDMEVAGANSFGKINYYDHQGQFKKVTKLFLGENAANFTPLLYTESLTPNLFLNDGQQTFAYASKHFANGKGYNIFRIAKNSTEVIFETKGDETKGNVFGNQFITNANNQIKKMALLYSTGNYNMTIDFYDLPFSFLQTQDNSMKNDLLIYVDQFAQNIQWNKMAASYSVYSMTGSLIRQGINSESLSSSGLPKGVYVLAITTKKGEKLTKRFIL